MAESQLLKLATPIPKKYIGNNGRNREAAEHTVVTQILLLAVGPYTFRILRELYSVPKGSKDGEKVLTGVIGQLRCKIDGEWVEIEEAGGVENALNQDGDGERAKHASSDALKRCAMRLGLGLHIWAQDHYFLFAKLKERTEGPKTASNGSQTDTPTPTPQTESQESTEAPSGQSADSNGQSNRPTEPQVDKKAVLELIRLIEKAGRSTAKFEEHYGSIDEYMDPKLLSTWTKKLNQEIKEKEDA